MIAGPVPMSDRADPPSFAISERSIDRPRPSCDRRNFKPLVLGQNQSNADTLEDGHLSKKSAVGGDGMRSIASGIVPAAEAEQILFREAALPVPRHARVQQAGMAHGRRQVAKRRFQHFARLGGAGARHGFAGARVPHLPGRAIEDRFDEDGAYIEFVWIRPVRQAHGIGKSVVPWSLVVNRVALGIAGRQRLDQHSFRCRDASCQASAAAFPRESIRSQGKL